MWNLVRRCISLQLNSKFGVKYFRLLSPITMVSVINLKERLTNFWYRACTLSENVSTNRLLVHL
jgi:hypothetical protein